MSITIGNTSTGGGGGSSLTISHTVAAGSTLLIATVGARIIPPDITGATYGGIAMYEISSANSGSGEGLKIYALLNPTVGTADVVFTTRAVADKIGSCADFAGANVDDAALTFGTVTSAVGTATSNTLSPLSNTAIDTDLIYAASFITNHNYNQTPSNGQTEINDATYSTTIGIADGYLAASSGSTTIGWSFTSATYLITALAIHPAGIAVIAPSADTTMLSTAATTNYDTLATMRIGESNAAAATYRAWTKPAFTNIPAGAIFSGAKFVITPTDDYTSNARTLYMHRCLRAVVSTQATWNIWKTSNNWGTAGASNSTTDYDGAVVLGSVAASATPTLNTAIEMTLDHAELQKLFDGTYTNNGAVLFVDTQDNDLTYYGSIESATAAYQPRFVIQYSASFIPQVIWI